MPLPMALSCSPMTPNLLTRRDKGALPSSPQVVMPISRSFCSVWEPMPQSFFTGRVSKTDCTAASSIHRSPSGFARSLASFATSMFAPMPTVQVRPSSSLPLP